MYISLKERKNKKDVKVYYIYVCESVRIEGKVKNTQRYFGSIKETELKENDLSLLHNVMKEEKFTAKEVYKVEDKLKALLEPTEELLEV